MPTETSEVAQLREELAELQKEVADLNNEVDRLQSDIDWADEDAEFEAEQIIEAAFVKQAAFLDDLARECHDDYQHSDVLLFCRATPCAQLRVENERREAERRKQRTR